MDSCKGLTLLVTRPKPENAYFCQQIVQQGGIAISLPLIEILPIKSTILPFEKKVISGFVFISKPAVYHGFSFLINEYFALSQQGLVLNDMILYAVGKGSGESLSELLRQRKQAALQSCDDQLELFLNKIQIFFPVLAHGSEALLALPRLQQVQDERWLIIRGRGGLELLRDSLHHHGALVEYLEVYERKPVFIEPNKVRPLFLANKIDAILISSGEILDCLCNALKACLSINEMNNVKSAEAWVLSERVANLAKAQGFSRIKLFANSASIF